MKFAKNTDQIAWKHLPQRVENESKKMDKELGFLGPKNDNTFGSKGLGQLSYMKVSRWPEETLQMTASGKKI